jgi:hypothetical protein
VSPTCAPIVHARVTRSRTRKRNLHLRLRAAMVSTLRCDLRSHLSVQEISVEEAITRRAAGFQRLLRGRHWESSAGVTWLARRIVRSNRRHSYCPREESTDPFATRDGARPSQSPRSDESTPFLEVAWLRNAGSATSSVRPRGRCSPSGSRSASSSGGWYECRRQAPPNRLSAQMPDPMDAFL